VRTRALRRGDWQVPELRSRLRIGILAPPWLPVPPSAYGGTENVLDALATGLANRGHDVLLFTTGDATCPVPRQWTFNKALGVGGGGVADEIRQVIDAYAAFEQAGVDVVHDHTLTGPLYAKWVPGLPVVTTNHGPFDSTVNGLYSAVSRSVNVIAISAHQASSASAGTVSAVVHHGIDLETVPFGHGTGGYAAFLGRMHADKGVDIAIDVARAAGIPLRIAAKMREPHEFEYFARVIRPKLGSGADYIGEVTGAGKFRFLGDAVCLLNPIGRGYFASSSHVSFL
jgi:glycosyltransferase involved in cell wall biosynthesis